jgi:Uma2 family endonuclease
MHMMEYALQSIPLDEVYYPETDGEPMAESDFQRNPLIYAVKALEFHFAHRSDVYVSGDLLIYYVEGDPFKSIAPDVFVVFGVPNHLRSTYKVWKEGKGPDVVIEIASPSTHEKDEIDKPVIYRELGVQEYFQYDPLGEYLTPALQGRRLDPSSNYQPIPASSQNGSGSVLILQSRVLDLELHLEGGRLRFFNPANGSYLLSYEEAEAGRIQAKAQARAEAEARKQAEEARKQAEEARKQAEEARKQAEYRYKIEAEARKKETEVLRETEARYQTEAEARKRAEEAQRQAEERIKALEAEMQRLHARGE